MSDLPTDTWTVTTPTGTDTVTTVFLDVQDGALLFRDHTFGPVERAYAPGQWSTVTRVPDREPA